MRRVVASLLIASFSTVSIRAYAAITDGYVVRVDSATVYLDWGNASDVHAGDRFQVYRAGAILKHPVTGEVLGHTHISVAEGSIERVEAKFSVGHLYQSSLPADVGDRTHYEETATSPSVVSSAPAATESLTTPISGLTELWRSDPLEGEAVGLSVGDIDGDGHQEIVVATADKIEAFRIVDKKVVSIAVFKERLYRHWIGIETGDPGQSGRDDIFATLWQDTFHRSSVIILRWENGKLKQIGELNGFVRSIGRADGSKVLAWQNMSSGREKTYSAPARLILDKATYRGGPSLGLSRLRDDQLFGFTLGDWDHDQNEDLALLQNGDALRVFFQSGKWSAPDSYGGTKNSFTTDDAGHRGTFPPRLLTWALTSSSQTLIVSRNIDSGVRSEYFKFFKKSEITAFTWNGSAMAPVWSQPIGGYLADVIIGDGLNTAPSQLWAAASGSSGKTILLAYRLP